jgi:hypothetical protein
LSKQNDCAPSSRKARQLLTTVVVVVALLIVFVGGRLLEWLAPRANEAQCKQLIERYFEHQVYVRHRGVSPVDIAEARRKARTRPAYLDDLRRCHAQLSIVQVNCGIRSPSMDALEQCLQ